MLVSSAVGLTSSTLLYVEDRNEWRLRLQNFWYGYENLAQYLNAAQYLAVEI